MERGKAIPREREVDKRRELCEHEGLVCAKESACVQVHGKSWHQCRVSLSLSFWISLSLSLSSLSEIRIIQVLFLNVSAEYL